MSGVVEFMNGSVGRGVRIIGGVALIASGLLSLSGTIGLIVALIGVVPLVMGIWGRCLIEFVAPSAHHAV